MTGFHLAQFNLARLKAPIDAPETADFVANLDRINALAESHAGFVWRLKGEGFDSTSQPIKSDPLLIPNLSVWESPQALGAFVYRSDHMPILKRRREWFEHMEVYMALWWIPAGFRPTFDDGFAKLETLARLGPSAEAFTFRDAFSAPGSSAPDSALEQC